MEGPHGAAVGVEGEAATLKTNVPRLEQLGPKPVAPGVLKAAVVEVEEHLQETLEAVGVLRSEINFLSQDLNLFRIEIYFIRKIQKDCFYD